MNDVEVATAWLKSIGRWKDDITEYQIIAELAKERESLKQEVSGA